MRKDILPFYRALGLSPGAEAIEIRRAYRQMIQQWHPDLFKPGSPMQTTAEDITKEINEAYEQLYRKKLYRNFLPKSERKEDTRSKPGAEGPAQPREAAVPKPEKRTRTRPPSRRTAIEWARWQSMWSKVRRSRSTRAMLLLAVAALVLFAGRAWIESTDFGVNPARADTEVQATATEAHRLARAPALLPPASAARPPESAPLAPEMDPMATRFHAVAPLELQAANESDHALIMERAGALLDAIELGDGKARVRAIQGIPDEVSDKIYRYGSSVVYFKEGRVSGWRNRLPRLRIRDWSEDVLPTLDRFTLGSSRSDVVRAQGLPDSYDATSYSYGSSVVNFDKGQVSGWSEGDVHLQHFEMPALPFIELNRLTLLETRASLEF